MSPERLLRIAAAYHAVVALVLMALPRDLFTFLGVEIPRYWLFYYLCAGCAAVAALACEIARRRSDLRPGLLFGLIAGNLATGVIILYFVVWSELPQALLGTGAAAGLWAWLLWGVYSPLLPPKEAVVSTEAPPDAVQDEEPSQG